MASKRKALICPLDWGIGHATRCVPVIRALEELGFEVVVAASGRPLEFIRKEYPEILTVDFHGTNILYPRNSRVAQKIFRLLPGFLVGIWREHRDLKTIVARLGVTLIISDNRYGCWHSEIPSVFITHQLSIQVPRKLKFTRGFINAINYWFIRKYKACWIPDFEPHRGLSGALSHPRKLPFNATTLASSPASRNSLTHTLPV